MFQEGRGTVSLIPSILSGVTLCVGPIASALVNRYGCCTVTIAGAMLAATGLAISAATTNVFTLYITVGLGTGMFMLFISLNPLRTLLSTHYTRLGFWPHVPAGHRQRLHVL